MYFVFRKIRGTKIRFRIGCKILIIRLKMIKNLK